MPYFIEGEGIGKIEILPCKLEDLTYSSPGFNDLIKEDKIEVLIHKHVMGLDLNYEFSIELPNNSIILQYQLQNGVPVFWYMFDEKYSEILECRNFIVLGTGCKFNLTEGHYKGTVQVEGLVYHLIERIV